MGRMQSAKATTSALQLRDYCHSPCVPTSAQEKNKAQNSTSFQTLNQFVGLSKNNGAARRVFHTVISRGNERDWGSPCLSLVSHVPICWLCNTFWEGILRVNMFNITLISSLKLSGLQRDGFRRGFFIFSDLLPGNPCHCC